MRKTPFVTFDRLMLVSAFVFQVIQFTRVFLLLDTGPLAWASGITGGIMAASGVTYIASRAPVVANKSKSRSKATWGAFIAILVISPALVAITNYITADPHLSGFSRYVFAICAALIADAFIAGVAFAGGALAGSPNAAPAKTENAPATQIAPKQSLYRAECAHGCGWSGGYLSQIGATNAQSAHEAHCKKKETHDDCPSSQLPLLSDRPRTTSA